MQVLSNAWDFLQTSRPRHTDKHFGCAPPFMSARQLKHVDRI
jgi:hypothetical protein